MGRPPPEPLASLAQPDRAGEGINRTLLAGLLYDVARAADPGQGEAAGGNRPDRRMEQLRDLLLGGEIRTLSRLAGMIDDPEQLAAAVGRILPTSFAHAIADARLGQVLAPVVEQAAQNSIANDPDRLIGILQPLVVPAIRKSIREAIDYTFQSLNETLRHSLSWRGIKWRWEAWRTGTSFAEVVLRHTLVYRVEHAFLIHRHTGLLIGHAATADAAGQDPQLVAAMLSAIQDFMRDSFGGEHGLDTLRFGDLRLWAEPGPSATLVAVIRGNPPADLRDVLTEAVTHMHAERHRALEDFNGDAGGFADIEAQLATIVGRAQATPVRRTTGVRRLSFAVLLALLALWAFERFQQGRRWDAFVSLVRSQPGIVVTEARRNGSLFQIAGLRDPLAADPAELLRQVGLDPAQVSAWWTPYLALDPPLVLARLDRVLDPPPGVELALSDGRIKARGVAPADWIARAQAAAAALPVGAPVLDLAGLVEADAAAQHRWQEYLAALNAQPGIVVTRTATHDGFFQIAGLRDPLAADPGRMLVDAGIDPARVQSHWSPYAALDPSLVLKRLQANLDPPAGVSLTLTGQGIVIRGDASPGWIERARAGAHMLPAGAPGVDLSGLRPAVDGELALLRDTIQARTIRFDYNEPLPAPGQEAALDAIAADLNRLAARSAVLGLPSRVTVTGHADDKGSGTFNLSLSLARAEAVRSLLRRRRVNPDLLAVRGAGALEPLREDASEAARSANHRVSFNVEIEPRP